MTIYFNGAYTDDVVTIDFDDRGYQFGDGIYEVIRVYNGKLFTAREHFERLLRSAQEIMINLTMTIDELIEICETLIEKNDLVDGSIYVQVTRGVSKRNHAFPGPDIQPAVLLYTNVVKRPHDQLQHGIKAITAEDIRWLRCDIKSLNLLGNVLNKQRAVEAGAQECIQIRDGIVTEGASSNVYMVKNGELYTHEVNHLILNGITRQVIIECAEALNIPVHEESFSPELLMDADEVFISSTTQEVMPVVQIDDQQFGEPGPVTRQLQQAFENKIADGR